MTSLRKIVEKKKCEKYSWPEGWMTKEQAANDLGVAPRDVDDMLKEAIRDGDVERNHFTVYDAKAGRTMRVPGYRIAEPKTADASPAHITVADIPAEKVTRILAAILRCGIGASNRDVAKKLSGVTSREIEAVRAAQSA
jgi:hypothetical protein